MAVAKPKQVGVVFLNDPIDVDAAPPADEGPYEPARFDDTDIEVAWFAAIEGARIMWTDLMNSPPKTEEIIDTIKDLFNPWAVLKMAQYSKQSNQ